MVRFLHILTIELVKFAGELDMGYAEKRGLKILVGSIEKKDLSPCSIVYIHLFFSLFYQLLEVKSCLFLPRN